MKTGPRIGPLVRDARRYEVALRGVILNPIIRRMNARVRAAGASHAALRTAILEAGADPRLDQLSEAQASRYLSSMVRWHKARFTKTMSRFLGVGRLRLNDGYVAEPLENRISENVRLIRTIETRYHDGLLRRMLELRDDAPFDQQALAKILRTEFRSTGYNLRRLTRDQTSKFVGELNEIRQVEVGVERYQWLTSRDGRVRPTHAANEGQIFTWDSPPADTGHPGHDIQCRCVAVAVLDPVPTRTATATPPRSPREEALDEIRGRRTSILPRPLEERRPFNVDPYPRVARTTSERETVGKWTDRRAGLGRSLNNIEPPAWTAHAQEARDVRRVIHDTANREDALTLLSRLRRNPRSGPVRLRDAPDVAQRAADDIARIADGDVVYNLDGIRVRISPDIGHGGLAHMERNLIELRTTSGPRALETAAHELGHFLERRGGLAEVSGREIMRRISDDSIWRSARGYRQTLWPHNHDDYATELISEGIGKLIKNPAEFARKDPDLFEFIYARVLRNDGP